MWNLRKVDLIKAEIKIMIARDWGEEEEQDGGEQLFHENKATVRWG